MSEEPDDFQSALVATTACWLAGNQLRYFLAAILSLCGKLGCAVWKLLEVALDNFPCWLPVIIIIPMMTASHHNKRSRGNPMWGANQRAVASGNYSHSCWLEVIGLLAHVRTKNGACHLPTGLYHINLNKSVYYSFVYGVAYPVRAICPFARKTLHVPFGRKGMNGGNRSVFRQANSPTVHY